MLKKIILVIVATTLLSACRSEKSETVEVKDFKYFLEMRLISRPTDMQTEIDGISTIHLSSQSGGSLKLSNGDRFEIHLNKGDIIYGKNGVYAGSEACCQLAPTPLFPYLLTNDEDLEMEARFIRGSEIADKFKIRFNNLPVFTEIIEPNFVYSLERGQDIVISWQPNSNNFKYISFTRGEGAECMPNFQPTYEITPNQTSLSIPVDNPEQCAEQFTLKLMGSAKLVEEQLETELTHAPVLYVASHSVKLDLLITKK